MVLSLYRLQEQGKKLIRNHLIDCERKNISKVLCFVLRIGKKPLEPVFVSISHNLLKPIIYK